MSPVSPTFIVSLLLLFDVACVVVDDYHLQCAPLNENSPCLVECGGSPILRFDLSLLQPPTGKYITKQDQQGHNYFFEACGPTRVVKCGQLDPKTVAAVQSWGGSAPDIAADFCASIGAYAQRNCTVKDAPLGSGVAPSMICQYGADPRQPTSRTVEFRYDCDPNQPASALPGGTFSAEQTSTSPLKYTIRLRGRGACGQVWVKPLSLGSSFLIIFFGSVMLYLAGGIGYNVKVGNQHGIQAIPQLEYWKELPGLVADGCKYSWQQGKKAYFKYMRGGSAPPLDPSLTRRLAEDVEKPDRT